MTDNKTKIFEYLNNNISCTREEFNNKDDIKKYKQTKLEELNNEIQELEAALKLIP